MKLKENRRSSRWAKAGSVCSTRKGEHQRGGDVTVIGVPKESAAWFDFQNPPSPPVTKKPKFFY